MPLNQPYPTRKYVVAELLLALRSRAQLTQAQFAQRLGINRRNVQKWESGETYPTAENLRALMTLMLTLGAFTEGHESEEAADLWQQVSQDSPQRLPLFDPVWFDQWLAARPASGIGNLQPATGPSTATASPVAAGTHAAPSPDQLYERMDISGLTGVTKAQRAALMALGAVERSA